LLLGPGDRRSSSTSFVRQFLAGALPATTQGGIAFVDVRDAAKAMIDAFELGQAGQRYLVSAANLSVPAFFERLARLTGKPAPALKLPKQPALALLSHTLFDAAVRWTGGHNPVNRESIDVGSYYWYCDCSKAERELQFRPRDGIDTLRDTVEDILAEPPVAS
jgi:dihydroflavonol-4-reductase